MTKSSEVRLASEGSDQSVSVISRSQALAVDRYVSMRVRQRRIMLGLSQLQIAEPIGVTCQQIQKYEAGISRISAGRLYQIAQALDVKVEYFFEDVKPG